MKDARTHLSIYLSAEMKEMARRSAYEDNRSLSSLVVRLLREHLVLEGYLPAGFGRRRGTPRPGAPEGNTPDSGGDVVVASNCQNQLELQTVEGP